MKKTNDIKVFFQYVIPSVLSFALSGVYAIVDGFFVGNSMGDIRLKRMKNGPENLQRVLYGC